MSSLLKQAHSSELMNVSIKLGDSLIQFNLYKELRITDQNVNDDILAQSRLYSFLSMAHTRAVEKREKAEAYKEQIEAKLYLIYKKRLGEHGRPTSDDVAKAKTRSNSKYHKAVDAIINAKRDEKTLLTCLKGFEQRKDLIQTLSSNLRNQT